MNAATTYSAPVSWILSHVTDADMFLVQSAVTCCALFWLLHRAWLTLWKPVPELISILGVEVPDAPAVSLAGIKSDAVTLHWTKPGVNKPVTKYLIQVNGVNVGESSRLETAITVTGLKPGHFYNVRVIAVGPNNFQAGGGVIRLRTYGRDGRPQLPNGRTSSNHSVEDQNGSDSGDESLGVRSSSVGLEAAPILDGVQAMAREQPSGNHPVQRRNTGGRKHSPSNAADHMPPANSVSDHSEESMQQLTERFEVIRKDIEELTVQISKDSEEFKSQMLDLMRERDEKRQALKEKEEASEKLKKEVHNSERANRQAQNRKTQKEKILREKQSDRTRMQEDLVRWKNEIEDMKIERELWQKEREKLDATKDAKAEELRAAIRKRQRLLNGLEEEIRVKGLQIKELEEERKNLPGGEDDEESRECDAAEAQSNLEWELKERELAAQLHTQSLHLRQLQAEFHGQQALYAALSVRQPNNPLMYQGNSSAVDLDPGSNQGKTKSRRSRNRKSRTNTISAPIAGYPITDSQFPSASIYNSLNNPNPPAFAPGPYFDLSNDTAMVPLSGQLNMSEADARALTAGAPLSPTATALLPSNIFTDDDPPSPRDEALTPFGPTLYSSLGPSNQDDHPQSPGSSSRSASLMSSPQASSHNLAIYGVSARDYGAEADKRSLNSPRTVDYRNAFGLPSGPNASKGFGHIFTFSRARGKTAGEDGHALGSLRYGQSASFPRSTDEPESINNRSRRISFSSGWNVMPSFLTRNSPAGEAAAGNAPAPARSLEARRRRAFNMFGSNLDDPSGLFSDRDPSSPRPVSIASSDLPRPSTDSAPFGWPATDGHVINRNSPLATNWSVNVLHPWSANPSRRPSMQHGSTTGATSGIASDDDEFLPPETGQSSPPPVGVIGTRPPSSQKPVTPRLNPAAPTFKAMFSRSSKADKGKGREKTTELTDDRPLTAETTSPAESRKSRDAPSIRTQDSMAESRDSLEKTSSNTPSDMAQTTQGGKDKESSFRQLLRRKGSSSKFSLSSIRTKDSVRFGSRKGGSSATNSDRNASMERDGSFEEFDETVLGRSLESVTSSPLIGSLGSAEGKGKEKEAGTPKEGRINWGRFGLKKDKNKTRESLDVDRSEAETTGTEDEGIV